MSLTPKRNRPPTLGAAGLLEVGQRNESQYLGSSSIIGGVSPPVIAIESHGFPASDDTCVCTGCRAWTIRRTIPLGAVRSRRRVPSLAYVRVCAASASVTSMPRGRGPARGKNAPAAHAHYNKRASSTASEIPLLGSGLRRFVWPMNDQAADRTLGHRHNSPAAPCGQLEIDKKNKKVTSRVQASS